MAWLTFHAGLNIAGLDSDEAARLLEESHRQYLELYGPINATVVAVLAQLGMHLTDRERWTAARPVLEHALRLHETLQASPDRRTAIILTYYGATLRGLGNPEEARSILERALRIQIAEQGEGGEDPEVATTLAPLALALRDLGNPQSARPLLERAVAIRGSVYGRRHPWTATHMHHLGVVLADLGEFDAANRTLEEALSIRHSTYGPRSGIVAMSMQELARVLDELGNFTAARTLLAKALKIREQRYGKDHPKAIECRNLLESVEGKLG